MAKATTTIKQALHYGPEHSAWFADTQTLFNRVCAFYFAGIQAHSKILALTNKEALTALEKLTHTTQSHPTPIMPLSEIQSVSLYAGMWKVRSEQSIIVKHPRIECGGFDAVPSMEHTHRGLRGALPAPSVRCRPTKRLVGSRLDAIFWLTQRFVRSCFYPRERFTVEPANTSELAVGKELLRPSF